MAQPPSRTLFHPPPPNATRSDPLPLNTVSHCAARGPALSGPRHCHCHRHRHRARSSEGGGACGWSSFSGPAAISTPSGGGGGGGDAGYPPGARRYPQCWPSMSLSVPLPLPRPRPLSLRLDRCQSRTRGGVPGGGGVVFQARDPLTSKTLLTHLSAQSSSQIGLPGVSRDPLRSRPKAPAEKKFVISSTQPDTHSTDT